MGITGVIKRALVSRKVQTYNKQPTHSIRILLSYLIFIFLNIKKRFDFTHRYFDRCDG